MKNLRHLLSDYSIANDIEKLPLQYDLLTETDRRILYALYLKFKSRKSEFVKTGSIIGIANEWCMHSDVGLVSSCNKLVHRIYKNNDFFIKHDGNFGKMKYSKDLDAGAIRYTDIGINKELSKYFKYIDMKQIPMKENKVHSEDESEPLYLPNLIPLGIIGNYVNFCIGSLHSVIIPQFKFEDLLKRQKELVLNGKSEYYPNPIIEGNILYELEDYPNPSKTLFENGFGKYFCMPCYKIEDDKIILYGKHPKKGFGKDIINTDEISKNEGIRLRQFNCIYEYKNGHTYFDVLDMSDSSTKGYYNMKISIKPNKKIPFDKTFIKKILSLVSGPINFNILSFNENKNLNRISIDCALLYSFNDIKRLIEYELKNEKEFYNKKKIFAEITEIIAYIHYTHNDEIKSCIGKEFEKVTEIYEKKYLNKYKFTIQSFKSVLSNIKLHELYKRKENKDFIIKKLSDIDNKLKPENIINSILN